MVSRTTEHLEIRAALNPHYCRICPAVRILLRGRCSLPSRVCHAVFLYVYSPYDMELTLSFYRACTGVLVVDIFKKHLFGLAK